MPRRETSVASAILAFVCSALSVTSVEGQPPAIMPPRDGARTVAASDAPVRLDVLHTFTGYEAPQAPWALTLATNGKFYGLTTFGGSAYSGTSAIATITLEGKVSIVHVFSTASEEGSAPSPLIQATDGDFYGTTSSGGAFGFGTAYRMTPDGAVTVIHHFAGGPGDGAVPYAPLLQAADGNLYGTTTRGGPGDLGTVFMMTPSGVVSVAHAFAAAEEVRPTAAALMQASDGSFFGAGAYQIFRLSPSGLLSVYGTNAFGNTASGYSPSALIQTADGRFYGTTKGTCPISRYCGSGTIFTMTASGQFTVLHTLASFDQDGLVEGADGRLYGTAGGSVFAMTPIVGTFTTLYSFPGGRSPRGALVRSGDGSLYGTTSADASSGGAAFRVGPDGAVTEFAISYSDGPQDGAVPYASLLETSDGNVYGTTSGGGTYGLGTAFRMTRTGTVTLLHEFAGGADGAAPHAALILAADGNFYGTTLAGGTFGAGTVFRMAPDGVITIVYSLFPGTDGSAPSAALVQASDGYLYGTTDSTAFRLTLDGVFSVLHRFDRLVEGAGPNGLVHGTDGNFYGTTREYGGDYKYAGTVFRMTVTGVVTVLHGFVSGTDGAYPYAPLIQARDGSFYGTTMLAGPIFGGTAFRITPAGVFTVLHAFNSSLDGAYGSYGALLQASDGTFYGTMRSGAAGPYRGIVFRLASDGTFSLLHSFATGTGGSEPMAALIQGSDGILYGTTARGGSVDGGIVFALLTAPVILKQPDNQVVIPGQAASFTVPVAAVPMPIYQWQVSTGGLWTDLPASAECSGVTTATLTVANVSTSSSGTAFRLVATNDVGTVTSSPASLTVAMVIVTTQPISQAVTAGRNATFTVSAIGTLTPTYRWQNSTDGGSSWTNLSNGPSHSGVTDATLTVMSASASQNGTLYRCVAETSQGSDTSRVATLKVYGGMSVSPSALQFGAAKSGAAGALTAVTPAQVVAVRFAGASSGWVPVSNSSWLELSVGSDPAGSFKAAIVNPANVIGASALLTTTITLTSPTAPNSPLSIPVTLTVSQTSSGTSAPYGSFDSPPDGATGIMGAIPVTGWALDDVGVNRVELWRNCVDVIDRPRGACGSPAVGLPADYVFLGQALLLAGARPDVETRFPDAPLAPRAGWGFMLLTNALPHQARGAIVGGQGSYVLSAFAIDEESHASLLGTKRIAVDNDRADVPFGTIDTPEPGATVPDPSAPFQNFVFAYPAFGWAMTQAGKCIDTTSPTAYKVFIDGVQRPLESGNWIAGLNRSDLAAAFPALCNSANALAVYYINATALGLTTGLHTISWDVTDSAGQTVAGLGTRFFHVVASGGDAVGDAATDRLSSTGFRPGTPDTTDASDRSDVVNAVSRTDVAQGADVVQGFRPAGSRTVTVRIGGAGAAAVVVSPDAAGHRAVQFPIGGRLQLNLGGPVDAGYQQVGDERRALPIGSTLDAAAGTFAWEPPAGFFGPFALVFTAGAERIDVTVTIVDGTRAPQPIAMQIDAPRDGSVVDGDGLLVGGWALDPQATTGSGIDVVHVWAVRRDVAAAAPQFLGAATLDLARPDVAQAFGAPFQATGFQLAAASLVPGSYDVTVYARSARTGRWEAAQTVRITAR